MATSYTQEMESLSRAFAGLTIKKKDARANSYRDGLFGLPAELLNDILTRVCLLDLAPNVSELCVLIARIDSVLGGPCQPRWDMQDAQLFCASHAIS